jgi:hypothetical protein
MDSPLMSAPQPQPAGSSETQGEATSDLSAGTSTSLDVQGRLIPGTAVGSEYATLQVPGCTLISVLGRGGMGVVFLARQDRLQRLVAVKMLTAEASRDASFLAHLEREAQTLATLSHPNIVGCHDILSTGQGTFLVMQYIPGQLSVRDLLKRFGRLPEAIVARIASDTARGLAYALRKGICHRDIKPDNLLIYREDPAPPHTPEEVFLSHHARVMICDFGIARQALAGVPGTERVLGSPAYMAPEQAFGHAHTDFRADLYALGSTLYHLLTGSHPFCGGSNAESIRMKLDSDLPDPRLRGVTVSDDCQGILRRLGHREPVRRYASYTEFMADLDGWVARLQPTGSQLQPKHHRHAFWKGLAAGIAVVSLAAATATVLHFRRQFRPLPASCAASLGYWSGDHSAWRVASPDAETRGPTLVGLVPGSTLELRQPLHADTRVRFRVRLPIAGRIRCSLRQDGADRWSLCWDRRQGLSVLAATADGREIPLVDVPDRKPMEWLSLDLRMRDWQVDLYAEGRLRGLAPLKTPLGQARLVLQMEDGCLAQFTDLWITALR